MIFLARYREGTAGPGDEENSEIVWLDAEEALERDDVPDLIQMGHPFGFARNRAASPPLCMRTGTGSLHLLRISLSLLLSGNEFYFPIDLIGLFAYNPYKPTDYMGFKEGRYDKAVGASAPAKYPAGTNGAVRLRNPVYITQ